MYDSQKQAEALKILGQALLDIAEVLGTESTSVSTSVTPMPGSQRDIPVRPDGERKMWARPEKEREIALATVLGAFAANGGVLPRSEFYAVARSVGYDTRGLAGMSTKRAGLVQTPPHDRNARMLTPKGYERYGTLRHLDQRTA